MGVFSRVVVAQGVLVAIPPTGMGAGVGLEAVVHLALLTLTAVPGALLTTLVVRPPAGVVVVLIQPLVLAEEVGVLLAVPLTATSRALVAQAAKRLRSTVALLLGLVGIRQEFGGQSREFHS